MQHTRVLQLLCMMPLLNMMFTIYMATQWEKQCQAFSKTLKEDHLLFQGVRMQGLESMCNIHLLRTKEHGMILSILLLEL